MAIEWRDWCHSNQWPVKINHGTDRTVLKPPADPESVEGGLGAEPTAVSRGESGWRGRDPLMLKTFWQLSAYFSRKYFVFSNVFIISTLTVQTDVENIFLFISDEKDFNMTTSK